MLGHLQAQQYVDVLHLTRAPQIYGSSLGQDICDQNIFPSPLGMKAMLQIRLLNFKAVEGVLHPISRGFREALCYKTFSLIEWNEMFILTKISSKFVDKKYRDKKNQKKISNLAMEPEHHWFARV